MRAGWIVALAACAGEATPSTEDAPDTAPVGEPPPIDLVTPLGPDEARGGVITDPAALIGGLGAEGRPGDVLLVNDRVRFVIQAIDRASGGLVPQGGGVIDADVVRTDGSADNDVVVDWLPALDLGYLPVPTALEVVDDGVASGVAVVRVTGEEAGFGYLEAVNESPGLYPPRGLTLVTTYTLEAGSPLLRVETTVTATEAATVQPGDILQSFPGLVSAWAPGAGRVPTATAARDATLVVDDTTGLALGLFADDRDASAAPSSALDLLNFLVSFTSLFEPSGTLDAGATRSWTRWWGVARSPSTLTDAWLARTGAPTQQVTASVTDGQAGVPGVRVTALVDGAPWTLGLTDAQGLAAFTLPPGPVGFVADGTGTRVIDDLPGGAGQVAPLAEAGRRAAALASIRDGAAGAPLARGWGRAEGVPDAPLVLTPPGVLRVTGSPASFQVRVRAVDASPPDDAFGVAPPGGEAAVGLARGGSLDLPLEPGTYELLAWAGTRFEAHRETVTVTSGSTTTVDATGLTPAWSLPGWWLADTHVHAAPSFDGKVSPTHRALGLAAVGVDLWFASEHDVAVDHRELVDALGIADRLRAVPTVEVTPWVRGHVNVFPHPVDPDARAGGAWPWWEELQPDTTAQFDALLARTPGVLVQINHPFSPGLPTFASWSPGAIGRPDFWWDGFDAVEVIVPGQDPRGLDLYVDLVRTGLRVAATGSTDSHALLSNSPGLLATWVYAPEADRVDRLTDAHLVAAVEQGRTVATNGPMLQLDPLPGSVVRGGTLTVTAWAPSWIPVERVELLRDGERVQTQTLDADGRAVFDLSTPVDASFVAVARSTAGATDPGRWAAWAVASAVYVDADGDGWKAPRPPLVP